MAEKIVSPGVFTRENDLSFLSQGIGEIGAAIVGPFSKGPAFLPTIVNTQSEFEEIFGTPDGTYYTGYAVQNYLREAGTVTIVRVGHLGGYSQVAPIGIKVTLVSGSATGTYASGSEHIIGTLHATLSGSESTGFATSSITFANGTSTDTYFTISGSNIAYNGSASIDPSEGNDIGDVFGESPFGTKKAYTYTYFEKTATDLSAYLSAGSGSISLVQLPTQAFTDDTTYASTPMVKSQLISGQRSDLFRFHTLGDGNPYNTEYKVSIFNVKAAGVSGATDYATFSVVVRGFSDTDRKKSVKETYNNVNLDPASPNYIAKVIGDRNLTIDANGKQSENGDYANRSKLVRVEVSPEGSFPIIAAPFGHGAYINPIDATVETIVPAVIYSTGSVNNTASSAYRYSGIDLETTAVKINNTQYLKPLPGTEFSTGRNTDFTFDADITAIVSGSVSTYNFAYSLSTDDSAETIAKRQFTLAFQGGFDGVTPTKTIDKGVDISSGNSQGFNLATSIASGSVAYVKAINSVSNPDDFDINIIAAPGIVRRHHSYVFDYISEMCENREDVFFIGDVVGCDTNDTIDEAVAQGASVDSNYVGTYYPWVKTIDRNTNRLTAVPPSVLMPGIYAANDAVAAEWFAPAGLNRGGIVGAVSVLNRLTHAERDTLYEGKINPIASFPGEGIVAFGQKTLQEKSSALDRINVRRLLIKVKKYIASTSRYLVFEQNTSTTRSRFLNTVNPYLEAIQQRQGLYAFRVVMDESNNTPDVIDRNILAGQIFLQPTKTAEFIVLDFNILPTGASFSA